jgi:CRISPR-associated protein Cas5
MEKVIDISVLFEKPELDKLAVLWLEPLAPLSMVVSMPGSYYRSQGEPSIFMIYGMLENLLGWHFDDKIRRNIFKKMKSEFSKRYKIKDFSMESSEVSYYPVLQQHLKIEAPALMQPQKQFYEDFWTQHLKDRDERHLGGARNYDLKIERMVNLSKSLEKQAKSKSDKETKKQMTDRAKRIKAVIMKRYATLMPNYYSSPKKREFVLTTGAYGYKLHLTNGLSSLLSEVVDNYSCPLYIGTNEGWVNIKIQTL